VNNNYYEQEGCHSCRSVFELDEYDDGRSYFCTNNAPKRPPSGGIDREEQFCEPKSGFKEWDKGIQAWKKWAEGRQVDGWGLCDDYGQKLEPEGEV